MSINKDAATWLRGLRKHIDRSPHLTPLQQFYSGEANPKPESMVSGHQDLILRLISSLNTHYLDLMVQAIDEYIHGPLGVPPSDTDDGPVVRDALDHMRDTCRAFLPPLAPERTARMSDYFQSRPVHSWSYE